MKKYSGFTLIEMLIVMGIIIILMAAGIAGGRFAIQRANRIQKQNAVDNIEQALWGFYTDNRSFPNSAVPSVLLSSGGDLYEYMDAGAFDGGVTGRFWYFVNDLRQEFVVCAELNQLDGSIGIFCKGNGLDTMSPGGGVSFSPIPSDNVYTSDHAAHGQILSPPPSPSTWDGENRSW